MEAPITIRAGRRVTNLGAMAVAGGWTTASRSFIQGLDMWLLAQQIVLFPAFLHPHRLLFTPSRQ